MSEFQIVGAASQNARLPKTLVALAHGPDAGSGRCSGDGVTTFGIVMCGQVCVNVSTVILYIIDCHRGVYARDPVT